MCVKLCGMSSVSIREAQHNFAALVRRVQHGEEIEVLNRKVAVARLLPPRSLKLGTTKIDWSDVPKRLSKIWGKKPAAGTSTQALLDDLRGER
jgi:prevent-host-death family protein